MNLHPSLQIDILKHKLSATDYKAIKFSEGWLGEEEYAPVKAERQFLREEINALEKLLENDERS